MDFDFQALAPRDRYKLLGGLVIPRPIALVTSRSPEGHDNAAPFSFFNVMAEEPPLVVLGLGVAASGGVKDTTNNILETGEFVVNLVDEPLAEAMNLCAVDFPPEISEIEIAALELLPSERVRAARIARAPVHLECRRMMTLQPGRERYIVLGEVLWLHVREGIVDPDSLRIAPGYAPIGRLFGGGYVRSHDRFELPRQTFAEWRARQAKS
ncbi:MAG TPA: flavin reductase family protein [Geminicoccaceae bacterium]|nr:flavin reductase family protein [Geminicoccaceae bacterium]